MQLMTQENTREQKKTKKTVRTKRRTAKRKSIGDVDAKATPDDARAKAVATQVDVAVVAAEPTGSENVAAEKAGAAKRTSKRGRSSKRRQPSSGSTGKVSVDSADRPAEATSESSDAVAAKPEKTTKRTRRKKSRARETGTAAAEKKTPTTAKASTSRTRRTSRVATPRASSDDKASRQMLINVSEGDECRIAVLLDGRLEELFIERAATVSHVGNIYKGRVTNIEPTIQAAFIDFGLPQNGFLHISDVQPQYFPDHKGEAEDVGRKIPRHSRPRIQDCFRRGQEVIVQVSREGVGTKGPTLTTYLSIPGRFLVMMPGMNRHGVSRKIEDEADRRTMREALKQLELPSGMGYILRTAGLGRTTRELQRDLHYLMRLWKAVVDRIKEQPAPAELYRESDLITRTIRDVYTADFEKVVVDDLHAAERTREFLQIAMPRSKPAVEVHSAREPLFHRFGIENEIERINMRHVPLPSGGSLVIDTTEALVAIDVNSGRARVGDDADETVFKTNLEAAEEIARQLRLRDLGGLIVCDFIDMRHDNQKRAVERALRDALKQHKERARTLKLSAFGLLEITRQRQGPSLKRNIFSDCPHCKGRGVVKMPDSVILDVMRILQLATSRKDVSKVFVTVAGSVAFQILNSKRAALARVESETGKKIVIRGAPGYTSDQVTYACEDARGQPVNAIPAQPDFGRLPSST